MTDRRRKGSLGWYSNSKRGLRSLIPVVSDREGVYCTKIGMITAQIDGSATPLTLLEVVPMQRDLNYKPEDSSKNLWSLKFSKLNAKCVRRVDASRLLTTEHQTHADLLDSVVRSEYVDVIGLSKGRGTIGPVARRNLKLQKRKSKSSGVTRKPGSMGLRRDGRVPWTKPFAGKTGNSRRTLLNLRNMGLVTVKNYTSLRYYIKENHVLGVKGSVVGPTGRTVFVRRAIRK